MNKKPTEYGIERRKRILEYLQKHERLVVPASIREIGDACSISSSSVIDYHLDQLEKQGKIKRHGGMARFIELVKE